MRNANADTSPTLKYIPGTQPRAAEIDDKQLRLLLYL